MKDNLKKTIIEFENNPDIYEKIQNKYNNVKINISIKLGERPSEEDLAEVYKFGNSYYDILGLMVEEVNSLFVIAPLLCYANYQQSYNSSKVFSF